MRENGGSDAKAGETKKGNTSLTQQAYLTLRKSILNWTMPPGTEVSEAGLSQKLEMSKTPVREALVQLRSEGFVETYPRRGYRVLPITVADMNELFEIRTLVEAEAAALAAERATAEQFDELERRADAYYCIEESESLERFISSNREFHAAIAHATGNLRLYQLTLAQIDALERFFYLGAISRDLNPETNADHHRIVEVLRRRDPAEARQVMRDHNRMTREGLMQVIANSTSRTITI